MPRDGARELRGPRDGSRPGPLVHLGQGRPGGAARPRHRLHDRHPGPHGVGGLAHVRLLHARRAALLCRNVLPSRGTPRHALLPPSRAGAGRGVARRAGAGPGAGRRAGRRRAEGAAAGREPARGCGGRRSRGGWRRIGRSWCRRRYRTVARRAVGCRRARPRRVAGPGRCGARRRFRPRMGRLRPGAEVPPAHPRRAVPAPGGSRGCRRRARPADGAADARCHGGRRHLRPSRRRLLPLLDGCPLARAPLREDAHRPGAPRPGLSACVAGHGARGVLGRRHRDPGFRPAGPLDPRGRPLLVLRRRRRWSRGSARDLHPRRIARDPARTARRTGGRVVRDHRAGQLGGTFHPGTPGRSAARATARDRGGPCPAGRGAGTATSNPPATRRC